MNQTKTLTCTLVVTLLLFNISNGQTTECLGDAASPDCPSCNGLVSTDPSSPENAARPDMKNHFNWMASSFNVYHPSGGYWGGTGIPFSITNPYYTTDSYLNHLNYFSLPFAERVPSALDFYPENGWELIQKGNGYGVDETTIVGTSDNRVGPFFILYNRYSSTLRTFAAFNGIGANEKMFTILAYNTAAGSLFSGLLNKYSEVIPPLDQTTPIARALQGADATASGQFFTTDFKMNYDPCVCNYNSTLFMNFSVKNVGTVNLSGRLIGTSVPLDGSGNSPLLNGRDFLTAVNYDENFDVQGGMITYSNIDKLIDLHKTTPLSETQKAALNMLKTAIKNPAANMDAYLGKASGKLATAFGASVDLTKDVVAFVAGAGIIGATSRILLADLLKEKKTPNISFIEAEMALSGKVGYNTPLGAGTIEFPQPGSKGTENSVNVPAKYYPLYNEALGTFAVFQKPSVLKRITAQTFSSSDCGSSGTITRRAFQFKFEKNSFKYFFNPAAQVNENNTRIYGALEFRTSVHEIESGANPISFHNGVHTYMTDFYPIESLERIAPKLFGEFCAGTNTDFVGQVFLKLQVFYEFLPNKYGKVNNYWEILTYPLNQTLTTSSLFTSVPPEDYAISGGMEVSGFPIHFNAGRAMTLAGQFNSSIPNTPVHLSAGEIVTISSSSTVRPGFNITAGRNGNIFADSRIPPVTAAFVKSFCSQTGAYQGKNFARTLTRAEDEYDNSESENQFRIFPNPASTSVSFDFTLSDPSHVTVEILDVSGRTVSSPISSKFFESGSHQLDTDVSTFKQGFYFCTLKTNKFKITRKLVIK